MTKLKAHLFKRINQVIFKSDNVLTAEVVQEMFRLRKQVENLVHDGHRWSDVCLRSLDSGSGSDL